MNRFTLVWLNLLMSVVCAGVFIGALALVSLINRWRFAGGASPGHEIAFPYAAILLVEAIGIIAAWIAFARRLPLTGRDRWKAGWLGSLPIWGAGLLCWAGAGAIFVMNYSNPSDPTAASVAVLGLLGLLAMVAASVCVLVVVWTRPRTPAAG